MAGRPLPGTRVRWLVALAGIAFRGHEPLPAQGAGPVGTELLAQRIRQSAVAWTPTRPLRWADFPAEVPAGESGAARLTTGLLYATACEGAVFLFGVEAAFVPSSSWVAARILSDSALGARILEHEQTHFDLSESVARELRHALAELPEPCRELQRGIPMMLDQFTTRERELQARYDSETIHGELRDRQHEWEARVRARLAALNAFSTTVVRRTP